MKRTLFILLIAALVTFESCGTNKSVLKCERYPLMYEEHPASILIMPPINQTTDEDAKEYIYSSVSRPLAEAGYYVFPPRLGMDLLKENSAYDTEEYINGDASIFANTIGADAVCIVVIHKFDKSFGRGKLYTDATYYVKSTHSNEILFEKRCDFVIDYSSFKSVSAPSSLGLIGLITSAVATTVANIASNVASAAQKHTMEAARMCSYYALYDIPKGKYHPLFMQDKDSSADKAKIKKTVKRN